MLRVTKDRKRKYVSLGISVNPEHWDFSKNQPKSDCPNREFIELMIAEKLKAYNSTIIELKATNQDFTSTSLVDKVQDKAKQLIERYRTSGNPYLFPIFSTLHKTEAQKKYRIHKVMAKVNKRLKIIGKELGIPITLTTYVARHSLEQLKFGLIST